MRKGIKIVSIISFIAVIAVCFSLVASAAVSTPLYSLDSSAYKISDATSGGSKPVFKNGKVTFQINLRDGLSITDAIVTVKFDKNVLRIADAGPVMKTDSDGEKTELIPGLHTHGYAENDDSAYTFAYINTLGYSTGSTGKAFAYITFEVIDSSRPATTVKFIAGPHASDDVIETYEKMSTLDACIISSVTPGNKALTVKWNSIPGADYYRVYRKVMSGSATNYEVVKEVTNTSFKDTLEIKNNTTYKYAVRAVKGSSLSTYVEKAYTYLDPMTLTVANASNGIKISWKKIDGATKYKVYKRTKGSTSWSALKLVEGNVYSVTDTSIKNGVTYEYTAKAIKGESVSANAAIKNGKYVSPVSKVTVANGYNGASIKWSAVSGAEKYRIYRRLADDNSWTEVKTVSKDVLSYVDSGATSGKTNYFAVRAYSNGTWSSLKTVAINYLATPKATKVYSTIGKGITIKWNAVAGVASYRVYRKAPGATKWSSVATTTKNYYVDKNVTLGKTYAYTLRAENGKNLSSYNKNGWSMQYTLTAPEITKITSSGTAISVKWSAVSGVDGYKLYKKAPGQAKWSLLKTTTATSFTDKNVKSGVVYSYTIRAYSGSSISSYNKTGWTGVVLKTPTTKISNYGDGIKVTWNKITGAKGYTVYSSQYNEKTNKWSSWQNRGTASSNKFAWVDKKTVSGVIYRYAVCAVNGSCKSSYKATEGLIHLAQPTVTIANSASGITVKWSKEAGALNYKIYRSQYNETNNTWSNWKAMGTASSSKSAWTDKSVVEGTTYKYTVRSAYGKTMSSYKGSSSLMFLPVPELVSCVKANNAITFEYGSVSQAAGYKIYRKTQYAGWGLVGTVNGNENTVYVDTDVIEGTAYTYTVRAFNGKSVSAYNTTGIVCAE